MTALETLYASGGKSDVAIIPTLELSCSAWAESIYICQGFDDITAKTEAGLTRKFVAAGIDVALPKRDNSGNQALTFAIDNVTGIAQQLIDQALDARAKIGMVFRVYVSNDLNAPAEAPYRMTVLGGTMEGSTVHLQAGYFDLINLAWPRRKYTLDFAPCLRYI